MIARLTTSSDGIVVTVAARDLDRLEHEHRLLEDVALCASRLLKWRGTFADFFCLDHELTVALDELPIDILELEPELIR